MPDDAGGRIAEGNPFADQQQLMTLLNGIFGTQNSGSTASDPGPDAMAGITQFLSMLLPDLNSDRYSPENAAKDADRIVQQIMSKYRDTDLPQIYQSQQGAGAYNSTTAQLLANDAMARATTQSGEAVLNNVNKYATLRQNGMNQMLNLVLGLLGASRRTSNSSTNNASTQAARNAAALANALRSRKTPEKPAPAAARSQSQKPTAEDRARESQDVAQDAMGDGSGTPNNNTASGDSTDDADNPFSLENQLGTDAGIVDPEQNAQDIMDGFGVDNTDSLLDNSSIDTGDNIDGGDGTDTMDIGDILDIFDFGPSEGDPVDFEDGGGADDLFTFDD